MPSMEKELKPTIFSQFIMIIKLKKQLNFAEGSSWLDIDTKIEEGTFLAISGASGSGKTSLLRLIAGLEKAATGFVEINGETWLDTANKINLPPQKRRVGYVFQNYALFPNMTVRQNLNYALEKHQPDAIIEELIEEMGLKSFVNERPFKLSGGQKQRVALARALVRKPKILLLDEPLSALDEAMRSSLQDYLLKVHQTYNLTTLLVSHDMGEIFKMANQVLALSTGKIVQFGTPESIFLNNRISGKYKVSGEVLQIVPSDVVFVVKIKLGNNIVRVIASEEEVQDMKVGERVLLIAKAFKPMIIREEKRK